MASEIRVNKIENRSGLGTVTFADTGVDLAGIVTATTFSGSGASLTSLPAAQLSGTLPALSAANLTSIPAANVTGTLPAISGANLTNLPAANVTGTLPAISGANLTNLTAANLTGALPAISAASCTSIPAANIVGVCTSGLTKTGGFGGITMADQWRTYNTQSISGSTATNVTSWERNDNTFAAIGSAMNESSGVFTFPTTGIYLVTYHFTFWDTGGDNRYITARMVFNDVYVSQPYTSLKHISGETFANVGSSVILDVTNTSHELRFSVVSEGTFQIAGNNWAGVGNENVNTCDVTFIRLGDT